MILSYIAVIYSLHRHYWFSFAFLKILEYFSLAFIFNLLAIFLVLYLTHFAKTRKILIHLVIERLARVEGNRCLNI